MDVVEAVLAQRGLDLLGVLLVGEPEEEPEQRTCRKVRVHEIDRCLSCCYGSQEPVDPSHPEPDMTTVPAAYNQFGYTLAFAERTLTAVLRQHLAERGTKPETWYALQLLTAPGRRFGARVARPA